MRVTGGQYKNRKLNVPGGRDVRPTSDRMRQSLFNMLRHASWAQDFDLNNARVVDLFCGSGALGIEALSHGARHCIFIDLDIKTIKQNTEFIDNLCFEIRKNDATKVVFNAVFDLVFIDPPYRQNLILPALHNLAHHNALNDKAIIIIESEKEWRGDDLPDCFETLDRREQGQSALNILRYCTAVEERE
jgi:16S rRNA (guanine966-N2)-methyltransferase